MAQVSAPGAYTALRRGGRCRRGGLPASALQNGCPRFRLPQPLVAENREPCAWGTDTRVISQRRETRTTPDKPTSNGFSKGRSVARASKRSQVEIGWLPASSPKLAAPLQMVFGDAEAQALRAPGEVADAVEGRRGGRAEFPVVGAPRG